jgi:hypothetical protein
MIEYIIVSFILIIFGFLGLKYWLRKRKIAHNPYYSIIIITIVIILFNIMFYFLPLPFDLIGGYILTAFLGAFLINFFYKIDYIPSLRFTSWFLFLITIGGYLLFIVIYPLIAAILLLL